MQSRLPLNNLNTFAAASENLSFQEAAEALFVTPSAVSHQIRSLEKLLGYKLFDRLDKKVRLTPRGQRLFDDIRVPMGLLREASKKALRGVEDNSLSLSVAPVFATGWLLPHLKNFHISHPDINLSVIASSDLTDFNLDPFDASIRMGKGDWDKVNSYHLFSANIVAVCHPDMLRTAKGSITVNQIVNLPLIDNLSMPQLWKKWFLSAGITSHLENHFKLQVQSSAQVIEALQSGDCIGLLDNNFIAKDIESERVKIACEHVLHDEEGYFLTVPEKAESLASFQCFKNWIFNQLDSDR